jgi:hypothetical protein
MNISRYLSLLLILLAAGKGPALAEPDSTFIPALRAGLDVSSIARHLMEPAARTLEATIDWEWRKNWFAAAEAGTLQVGVDKSSHNYQANGWFFRLGADYNFLKRPDPTHQDVVVASLRYGYGSLRHEAPFVRITDPFWGSLETVIPTESFSAHWLEFGGGLKTRIGRHFFLGWSVRTRFLISRKGGEQMDPYTISGYGRSDRNTVVMMHYALYYRIPLRAISQ